MYNSILQFLQLGIVEIEKSTRDFMGNGFDLTKLEVDLSVQLLKLGKNIIVEFLEVIDQNLRESEKRKRAFVIERSREPKSILTSYGWITYYRTLFTAKKDGKSCYLLDELIDDSLHGKMTLSVVKEILEEATQSSYEKGGRLAGHQEGVSKQTVKNLVHEIGADLPEPKPAVKKKKIKNLHIVADEDHVALQFRKEKGDLCVGKDGFKSNTIMPKLICLYEDIEKDGGEQSKRHRLTGKRYFGGLYQGEKNEDLWLSVAEYIENHYDTDYLERVYIAGDGGAWIKAGCEVIAKSRFVLDKYHLGKYIKRSVTHLLDSQDEVKESIYDALYEKDKAELKNIYQRILFVTKNERKEQEVRESLRYLLNHWSGITVYVEEAGAVWGCCAEGQVSHVYASRMSSRPMGWSKKGVEGMSRLRVYRENGGDLIDLVKYQKEKRKKEGRIEKQEELVKEMRQKITSKKYVEQIQGEVPGLELSNFRWMKDLLNRGLCI